MNTTSEAAATGNPFGRAGNAAKEDLRHPIKAAEASREKRRLKRLERVYGKKDWPTIPLTAYQLGKSATIGAIGAHVILGVESLGSVSSGLDHAFTPKYLAQETAFRNVTQGWGAGFPAKYLSYKGFSKKKDQTFLGDALGSAKKMDVAVDKFSAKFGAPSLAQWEEQGRVMKRKQRWALVGVAVGKAALITVPLFFGVHYVAHEILASSPPTTTLPALNLGGGSVLRHVPAASHVVAHSPFLTKLWNSIETKDLSGLPDKAIGLVGGLIGARTPLHLLAQDHNRRVAVKKIDGKPYFPGGPKRFYHRVGFVLWDSPLLGKHIRAERTYREQNPNYITKAKQLSHADIRAAKARAYEDTHVA